MSTPAIGRESIDPRRLPCLTALCTAAAILAYAIPGAAALLSYNRAITHDVWRVLSCHWVHWNNEHFLWSVGTFAVLGVLCEREQRKAFLLCVGGSAVLIPLALWVFMPGMDTYAGLSGLDSALFTFVAITLLRHKVREREWLQAGIGGFLILAFTGKTGFEFVTNATVFVDAESGLLPVPLAHAVGCAVGVLAALLLTPRKRRTRLASYTEPIKPIDA